VGPLVATYGPWGVVGSLVVLIVTAFAKKWIVPWSLLELVRTQQQQITDLHKDAAALERQRSDVIQGDLLKLMAELTEALRRSKPAS
jgi:hypothetical protein